MKFLFRSRVGELSLILFLIVIPIFGFCASIDNAIQIHKEHLNLGKQSQDRIEKLDDQAQQMLSEFREASRELENLKKYHDQLEKIVASQELEKTELTRQMLEIDTTQRNILPLMLRMLAILKEFIKLDTPFLLTERQLRVKELTQLLNRSDIDLSEKFHRLIDAYLIETEYGRTIEAYSGDLKFKDTNRTVEFLRFGRVGLYYLTLDGKECGYWDKTAKQWQTLSNKFRSKIEQGLRIAKKQSPPELIKLPIAAPEIIQ